MKRALLVLWAAIIASAAIVSAARAQCVGSLQANNNLSDVCSASTGRTNLGLGTIATQAANAVAITGGTVSGITALSTATTGAIFGAAGTTGERPATTAGGIRFNSTTGLLEFANGASWTGLGTGSGTVTSVSAGAGMDFTTITATGAVAMSANSRTTSIQFVIDGGGSAITTGIKGDLEVPFACTITAVRLLADQSGSIVVDLWKDTYANYPPVVGDSITASAKPTISSATKSEDTTLTGWTTTVTAGNILRFNVDSVTTIQRVTGAITCVKS